MNPRESSLLQASAILLARHGMDATYGPAHAVRDALALETEVQRQAMSFGEPGGEFVTGLSVISEAKAAEITDTLRNAGAL